MGSRDGAGSLTMHSSWRGILANVCGAGLVVLSGLVGVALGGWRLLPTGLLVIGLVLLLGVLADYPVATTFTAEGFRRRMTLRSQWIPWERVSQLTRVRPGVTRNLRGLTHGGLAAVVGKRRYLLVDQPESPQEFDALYELVGERAVDLGLAGRIRPDDETPPTWLYRRAKWAPDELRRR